MEVIKKTIKQAVTTGATTGCTGTTCYVIVPDLSAVYNFNFCLTQETKDWGFFDAIGVWYYGIYNVDDFGVGLANLDDLDDLEEDDFPTLLFLEEALEEFDQDIGDFDIDDPLNNPIGLSNLD